MDPAPYFSCKAAFEESLVPLTPEERQNLDEECFACRDSLGNNAEQDADDKIEEFVRLTCGHIVGRMCLKTWLERANTCPLCRAILYPGPRFSNYDSILWETLPEDVVALWEALRELNALYPALSGLGEPYSDTMFSNGEPILGEVPPEDVVDLGALGSIGAHWDMEDVADLGTFDPDDLLDFDEEVEWLRNLSINIQEHGIAE